MRWQQAETQVKQADSFRGCRLAQTTVLFLFAQGNCKKQAGRLLKKQTSGVQGRAGVPRDDEEQGQRCVSLGGTRDVRRSGSQLPPGSLHSYFPRRCCQPSPGCLTEPWAKLAKHRPRRAWSLRQSMRGKGQRHPGWPRGCNWSSMLPLPTIARRRCWAGCPGPQECPQLPNPSTAHLEMATITATNGAGVTALKLHRNEEM